jgi:PPK2 family polyphosphate:nucleotide phosphotransferase
LQALAAEVEPDPPAPACRAALGLLRGARVELEFGQTERPGACQSMNFTKELIVPPDTRMKLKKHPADETFGYANDTKLQEKLDHVRKRLDDLQYLLYAEKKHALLIVLQGIDAAGKDGTIRHVMSGVNPQGCQVTAFKVPTPEEEAHDFLWRIHRAVPERGMIGIFNRSHYEDVLVVRVHHLVPKATWKKRYEEINGFEKFLSENQVTILKFFLHISKKEQKRRFDERIADPSRNWKLSPADLAERQYWDDYMEAYADVLERCSTKAAPWFAIPADHKWFRNFAVSKIIMETLENFDMKFPKPTIGGPR